MPDELELQRLADDGCPHAERPQPPHEADEDAERSTDGPQPGGPAPGTFDVAETIWGRMPIASRP